MRKLFSLTVCLLLMMTVMLSSANQTSPERPVILAFGDSLTAGYGLPENAAFPVQLEAQLRADGYAAKVINGGVSGDTTAGGLARIDWALADKPQIVILELGANDALRGIDPEHTLDNLQRIIKRLRAADCRIVLAGMRAPRNLGPEYYNKFDRIYPMLAEQYGLLLYPFFLEGVAMDPNLNLPDGIHPNADGVRKIVAGIQPLVVTALADLENSGRAD